MGYIVWSKRLKITAIRVSKLVSGPGYNNISVAAEATLEHGDQEEALEVHDKLSNWVDEQLRISGQMQEYRAGRDRLLEEIRTLERKRDSLKREIKQAPDDDGIPF